MSARFPTLSTKLIRTCCMYSWLFLMAASARAEWGFDATAGLSYDDNLSNGFEAEDRKADTAAVVDHPRARNDRNVDFAGFGLANRGQNHGDRILKAQ